MAAVCHLEVVHKISIFGHVTDIECFFFSYACHHSLNGSSGSVKLRRPSIPMGIGKFQPPTKSIPLNQSTKNLAQLITTARGPCIPNLIQIHPLGASGQMGEI